MNTHDRISERTTPAPRQTPNSAWCHTPAILYTCLRETTVHRSANNKSCGGRVPSIRTLVLEVNSTHIDPFPEHANLLLLSFTIKYLTTWQPTPNRKIAKLNMVYRTMPKRSWGYGRTRVLDTFPSVRPRKKRNSTTPHPSVPLKKTRNSTSEFKECRGTAGHRIHRTPSRPLNSAITFQSLWFRAPVICHQIYFEVWNLLPGLFLSALK